MSSTRDDADRVRRGDAGFTMTMLILLWVIAVPALFFFSIFDVIAFSEPNPNQARGGVLVLIACFLAVALPATATVIGHRGRRPAGAAVCAVLTVAGLFVACTSAQSGLEWAGISEKTPPATHTRPVTTGGCADLSGGDTTCPGG